MGSLMDVLLYLARHVPAGMADLADMERIIAEHFGGPAPAPVPAPAPALQTEHVVDAAQYAQFLAWQAASAHVVFGQGAPAPAVDISHPLGETAAAPAAAQDTAS